MEGTLHRLVVGISGASGVIYGIRIPVSYTHLTLPTILRV